MSTTKDTPSAGAVGMANLLTLELEDLIKSDDEYLKIFEKRVRRLDTLADATVRRKECLEAKLKTIAAHEVAERLKTSIDAVNTLLAMSHEEKLRIVFRQHNQNAKNVFANAEQSPPSEATVTWYRQTTNKAYEALVEISKSVPANDVVTFKAAWEARLKDEPEDDRFTMNMMLMTTSHQLDTLNSHLQALGLFAQIATIYRALLYSGIMKKEGGRVESQARRAQLKETMRAIIDALLKGSGGVVLGESVGSTILGILQSMNAMKLLQEMIKIWGKDGELELLKDKDLLDSYLEMYGELLEVWTPLGTSLATTMNSMIGPGGYFDESRDIPFADAAKVFRGGT